MYFLFIFHLNSAKSFYFFNKRLSIIVRKKKTKKETKLALITILVFVALFILLDFILGFWLIPENYSFVRIKDPYFHHGLKPNVETKAAWGPIIYPFSTNNLGFRDASARKVSLKKDKKQKKKRILILGDSHSEGVGILFEYTFTGRLQKMGEEKKTEILKMPQQ